jgi:hypothetical protein
MLVTTIIPNGSCAFVFTYIFPKMKIKTLSTAIFAIETTDSTRDVDSI